MLESGGRALNAPEPLPGAQQGKRSLMGQRGDKLDVLASRTGGRKVPTILSAVLTPSSSS